jgi:hypothetical protein
MHRLRRASQSSSAFVGQAIDSKTKRTGFRLGSARMAESRDSTCQVNGGKHRIIEPVADCYPRHLLLRQALSSEQIVKEKPHHGALPRIQGIGIVSAFLLAAVPSPDAFAHSCLHWHHHLHMWGGGGGGDLGGILSSWPKLHQHTVKPS